MNSKLFIFPLIFTSLLPLTIPCSHVTAQPVLLAQREEQTRIQVYEKASPSVVTIRVETLLGEKGLGSGFIISNDGIILTNAHVVEDVISPVTVIMADNTELIADIIGFDPSGQDIAALKLRNVAKVKPLSIAKSNSVKVGQSVYAIGSPLGEENAGTFTTGVVSRLDRKTGRIQHDAAIHSGNSGGPLLNSKAEVIGINTSGLVPSVIDETGKVIGTSKGTIGINFAISIQSINSFLVAIKQGNTATAWASKPKQPSKVVALSLDGIATQGTITKSSAVLPDQTYYDVYNFEGKRGQKITVQINSQQLDPRLFLMYYDPLLDRMELISRNDDISPTNSSAAISLTLPEDGLYMVYAISFEPGETGSYNIKAVRR